MIGYIAKDKDGEIYLHPEEPEYNDTFNVWCSCPDFINITGHFPEFDNISYTDEPIKVEIKLERI
jgi:hypothetical protein